MCYNVHCVLVRDWQNRLFQARISHILSLYLSTSVETVLLVISCGFYSVWQRISTVGKIPSRPGGFGSSSPTISRPCNQLLSVFRWFGYRRAKHQSSHTAVLLLNTLQRKSHLCIPFLEKALPQPQFPHSCVCERFI